MDPTAQDAGSVVEIAIVIGGLLLSSLGAYAAVRAARRRRREMIEGAGEVRPRVEPKRKPLVLEEAEPEAEPGAGAEPEPPEEEEATQATGGGAQATPSPAKAARGKPDLKLVPEAPAEGPVEAKIIPFPATRPPPAAAPAKVEGARPAVPAEKPVTPVEKPTALAPPPRKRDAKALAPGLAKTRSGWISRLGQVFAGKKEIDPDLMGEIEKVLLTADIGVRTSQKLLDALRTSLGKKELAEPEAIWTFLRQRAAEILTLDAAPLDFGSARPFVLLVIGVNGSGKTTTIGKLASILGASGKKVVLGAGDTFRAAATEQLDIWAGRAGATLVRGKEGSDPSSVLFEAVKKAKTDGLDVVIADTAGRLHTKTDLMEELQKVRRVIGKAAEGAPHETWLVIDSTQGQNAIAQAQVFTQAMAVSGIVLTKLDGTAKGGVILGIADQLKIPVRYVGIGERVEDLREFDAEEFVEALFEREPT